VTGAPDWLGRQEAEGLEYESAAALGHRESITRTVVAMLNGRGGVVVVGVAGDGTVDGVPDVTERRDSLRSALVDGIEPAPLPAIHVQACRVGQRDVLEVRVESGETPPYADRHRGRYGFWARAGTTTRPMTPSEAWSLRESRSPPARGSWHDGLESWESPLLVLDLRPHREAPRWASGPLARALREIPELGMRPDGWGVGRVGVPRLRQGGVFVAGDRESARLEVAPDGHLRYEAGPERLVWQRPAGIGEPVVYPYCLVEPMATFCDLAGHVGDHVDASGGVRLTAGFWRARGWVLGPGHPASLGWRFPSGTWDPIDADVVAAKHRSSWERLREAAAEEAYALARRLYEELGYLEDAVPFWSKAERQFVWR